MSDWPLAPVPFNGLTHITPYSIESVGGGACTQLPQAWASAAWPAANRAIYIPFRISESFLFVNGFVLNGATANGNLDIGIYSFDGTRLCSTGAVAQSGTNALQSAAFTAAMRVGPGLFYMALSLSSGTGTTFMNNNVSLIDQRLLGMGQQATAHPLPATATFAASGTSYLPSMGITGRSVY